METCYRYSNTCYNNDNNNNIITIIIMNLIELSKLNHKYTCPNNLFQSSSSYLKYLSRNNMFKSHGTTVSDFAFSLQWLY